MRRDRIFRLHLRPSPIAFAFGLLVVIALAGCKKGVAEDEIIINLTLPAKLRLPPSSSPRVPALQPRQFEVASGKLQLRADAAEIDVQGLPTFIKGTQLFHYEAFLLMESELWIPVGPIKVDASGNGSLDVAYAGDGGFSEVSEDGGVSGLSVPPTTLIGATVAIVEDDRATRVPDPYSVLEGRRQLDGGH